MSSFIYKSSHELNLSSKIPSILENLINECDESLNLVNSFLKCNQDHFGLLDQNYKKLKNSLKSLKSLDFLHFSSNDNSNNFTILQLYLFDNMV